MDGFNMVFEMLQVFENESLRPAHRMKAVELLLWINPLQMGSLNMVTHLGNAAERAQPPLTNTERALFLATDKGEYGSGIFDVGRLLLDKRPYGKGDRESVPLRHLAEATQTQHEVGSPNPKLDRTLQLRGCRSRTDQASCARSGI
jgi:hypothetical protein